MFILNALACLTGAPKLTAQHSPYAHHADRAVSSLSEDEVTALLAGEGAGLALPAELNGFPGPKHVLELADSLVLTEAQRRRVETEFASMRDAAQRVGRQLVDAERALDDLFRSGAVTDGALRSRLESAQAHRAELRRIHLMAHVRVRDMLTADQIHTYQLLRGYH